MDDRFTGCRWDADTLAEPGGNELTYNLAEPGDFEEFERVAKPVPRRLARGYRLDGSSVAQSASIGIAFYPDHGEDTDKLLSSADEAMYAASNSGRNRFFYYP